MNEFDFARAFLGQFKIKGDEIVPRLCPFCHGGDHGDKETFALNYQTHVYKCLRGSCNEHGHFRQLCKKFGVDADNDRPYGVPEVKRTYKRPEVKPAPPTDAVTAYLKARGITAETAKAFGIGARDGNIMFPYYRDAEAAAAQEATFVKYREPRKIKPGERKMWREADTEPILFGMHLCDANDPTLYIFEGEFDAMCGYQASGLNCVSIPSGCEDFTWLETCYDWLHRFEVIGIFADNDIPGKKMLAELVRKLDFKVLRPEFALYGKSKDANEIMIRMGGAAVKTIMEAMRPAEVQGLLNLADVANVNPESMPRALTGIQALDKMTGGMFYGDLSVWTGKRGEGKSTLLSQILLEAVDAGVNVCAYSGEVPADRLKYIVNLQAAGASFVKTRTDDKSGRTVSYVPSDQLQKIQSWYNGKFWLYDNRMMQADETESVLKIFELAYRRYDCRVFLVDNLMTVNSTSSDRDALQIQADFTVKLRRLAERLGVHIHLVAHPRKTSEKAVTDNDNVSGLSAITNIACNVFSVHRCTKEEKAEHGCDSMIFCTKNRMYGELGAVKMNYNLDSRRFMEPGATELLYGWINEKVFETERCDPGF